MCLTAHYIEFEDEDSVILCIPYSTYWFCYSHKGLGIVKRVGIEKRVFTIIVDNASSNDNMQGLLNFNPFES